MQSVLAKLAEVKQLADGARILSDWIGDGGKPVIPELAAVRALTCIACIENSKLGLVAKVTGEVAAAIKEQMEVKNKIGMTVPNEDKLNTCRVCKCYLKLKIFVPLNHILDHTSPETLQRFPGNCWIPSEISKP